MRVTPEPKADEVKFWARQREIFSAFEGYYLDTLTVLGSGQARTITAVRVTDGLMAMLGVDAAQGRYLGAGDAGTADRPPAVVLSHGLWQSAFGADPAIVGRVVRLDALPHTVVGVMRPTFRFPFVTVQAWVGIPSTPPSPTTRSANYRPIGRLAAGVSAALAAGRMDIIRAEHLELRGPAGRRANLYPFGSRQVGPRVRPVARRDGGDATCDWLRRRSSDRIGHADPGRGSSALTFGHPRAARFARPLDRWRASGHRDRDARGRESAGSKLPAHDPGAPRDRRGAGRRVLGRGTGVAQSV